MAIRSPKQKELLQMMMQRYMQSSNPTALDEELFAQSQPPERPPEWGDPRPVEPQYGSLPNLGLPHRERSYGVLQSDQGGAAEPQLEPQPEAKVKPKPGADVFIQGMIKRGWTPDEVAGVAGNVHVESGFDPGINEKKPIAGRGGYGYIQLTGPRRVAYERFAADTGKDLGDPEAQMDWLNMERTGESRKYGIDEQRAYQRALGGGGTPEEIAERFGRFVERPRDLSATVAQRRTAARQYGAKATSWEENLAQVASMDPNAVLASMEDPNA